MKVYLRTSALLTANIDPEAPFKASDATDTLTRTHRLYNPYATLDSKTLSTATQRPEYNAFSSLKKTEASISESTTEEEATTKQSANYNTMTIGRGKKRSLASKSSTSMKLMRPSSSSSYCSLRQNSSTSSLHSSSTSTVGHALDEFHDTLLEIYAATILFINAGKGNRIVKMVLNLTRHT